LDSRSPYPVVHPDPDAVARTRYARNHAYGPVGDLGFAQSLLRRTPRRHPALIRVLSQCLARKEYDRDHRQAEYVHHVLLLKIALILCRKSVEKNAERKVLTLR